MYNKLKQFLLRNEEDALFIGEMSERKVLWVEGKLKVKFPEEVFRFLKDFGGIILYGEEIIGIGVLEYSPIVVENKKFRERRLPSNFLLLQNIDSEVLTCIDINTEKVIVLNRYFEVIERTGSSFSEYYLNYFIEEKENWDENDGFE